MYVCFSVLGSVEFVNMAYISDVTPKTYYDEDQAAYFVSVTTCVKLVTDISAASKPSLAVTATLDVIQVAADGVSTEHDHICLVISI